MIVFSIKNTTGKQAYREVVKAMKARTKATGVKSTQIDFCAVAGMNRVTLLRYRDGSQPGADGLFKIAEGLKAWGHEARVEA